MQNLAKFLKEEMSVAHLTPDVNRLRYNCGPIPLFLWDDNKSYDSLRELVDVEDFTKQVDLRFSSAVTKNKFVPWYNISDTDMTYPAYVLEEYDDLAFVQDVPEYWLTDPLQISGSLYYVSLEVITTLDYYYENTVAFRREKVEVHRSPWSKDTVEAHMYVNPFEYLFAPNEEGDYVEANKLDFTPFIQEKVTVTKEQVFTFK